MRTERFDVGLAAAAAMCWAASFWAAPALAAGQSHEEWMGAVSDKLVEQPDTPAPQPGPGEGVTIPLAPAGQAWSEFFDSFKWGEAAGYERQAWEDPLPWSPFYPVEEAGGSARKINPKARYAQWKLQSSRDPGYFSVVEVYYFRSPFQFYYIFKEKDGSTEFLSKWEDGAQWRLVGDPGKQGGRFEDVIVLFNRRPGMRDGQEMHVLEGFVADRAGDVLAAFESLYAADYSQDGAHSGFRRTGMLDYRMLGLEEAAPRWKAVLEMFLEPSPPGEM